MEKTVKDTARYLILFTLACDETTAITKTGQLVVFKHGLTAEFDTCKEFLFLQAMHGTTKGEDVFEKVFWVKTSWESQREAGAAIPTDGI